MSHFNRAARPPFTVRRDASRVVEARVSIEVQLPDGVYSTAQYTCIAGDVEDMRTLLERLSAAITEAEGGEPA